MKILIFILILISGNLYAQKTQVIQPGNVTSLRTNGNFVEITTDKALVRLEVYSPTIIRVRIVQKEFQNDFSYSVIQKAPDKKFNISEQKLRWILTTDSLIVSVEKKPFRLIFENLNRQILCEDYPEFSYSWMGTGVTSYKKLFQDEKFIGLGEKTGPLDRRGNAYTNWNTDIPAYEARQDPLYVSIPFYMGIHGGVVYGIFLDNSFKSHFNFGASTDDKFSSFSAEDGEMNYYFFGSKNIAGIIRDYTWLTGRMELPPYWSLGYQQCRWSYFPDTEVMDIAKEFRDRKIPCDVIYLDIHYMDNYKIFTWNKERFPDPAKMISGLKSLGFHVVTIVDPGIKIENDYQSYEEGKKNDLFVKYPDGSFYTGSVWPGRCHFPDFTKPATRDWWGKSFSVLTTPGVEGFWNDMNEPSAWGQSIPDIVQFDFEGKSTSMTRAHNIYGLEMSRATYEGTRKLLNGLRPFVLTRAAFAGIQRYSAVWTGDNKASEDHLLMGVRLVNSLGLSGVSFTGSDVGGFVDSPSKELFGRWMSVGVFTPFFRNHTEYNSNSQEPWAFGEDIENLSRSLVNLRYQLLPYLYSAFYGSTITGMPVARSLAIDYTFDPKIWWWAHMNQYMFGDAFLIAPTESGNKFSKIYLPEGTWYRFSSGEKYAGSSEYIVESPVSDLPVFVKGSSIIPMQSVVQFTGEQPSPILGLHIYNGEKPGRFVYYEDDGKSYNYQNGGFYKRVITFDPENKKITISAKEGTFDSKFNRIKLVFHGFEGLKEIKAGDKKIVVENNSAETELLNDEMMLLF